jgi:hypothetical protein
VVLVSLVSLVASGSFGATEGATELLSPNSPWGEERAALRAEVKKLQAEVKVLRNETTFDANEWHQHISIIHVFMGSILNQAVKEGEHSPSHHIRYTLESMRYNKNNVDFIIVNIQDDLDDTHQLVALAESMQVTNLKVVPLTMAAWSTLVEDKIGFDLPWNSSWYYKLNDYKPTFGLLFEDYIKGADWWGWMDLDVVFGQFAHFREFFEQTEAQMVSACYMRTCGPLTMIRNTPQNNAKFNTHSSYLKALKHEAPHQLDEQGDSSSWGRGAAMSRWWRGGIFYGNR